MPLRTSVALYGWAASEKWHAIGRPDLSKPNVRFGSKADVCSANRHVRFVPIADMAQTQVQFFISSRTDGLRGLHQLMAVTAIQTREPSNDER
jgi:hypothetical protein